MKVHAAQLAGDGRNADRLFATERAVILLDGASAFEPTDVDPGTYADALGRAIATQLDAESGIPIATAVAQAITETTERMHLTPGRSPSSTVSVIRTRDGAADLYVLGDSPIYYGTATRNATLLDDRLTAVGPAQHDAYAAALRAGHGFDDRHRAALAELQHVERQHRNTEPGYWIAETDPGAAHHALTITLAPDDITWAVMTSDGASDVLQHLGYDWTDIARHDAAQLAGLLARIHAWEERDDPHGRQLPRAKRHDDKTIAAIPSVW